MDIKNIKIAVVELGYVGLPLLVEYNIHSETLERKHVQLHQNNTNATLATATAQPYVYFY